MSVRKRVEQLSREVATAVAMQMMEVRLRQMQQNNSSMGKITKVEDNQLTLKTAAGDTVTVNNVGGRSVGVGDAVATDGKFIGI